MVDEPGTKLGERQSIDEPPARAPTQSAGPPGVAATVEPPSTLDEKHRHLKRILIGVAPAT